MPFKHVRALLGKAKVTAETVLFRFRTPSCSPLMQSMETRRLKEYLSVILFTGLFAAKLCFDKPSLLESFDYLEFYKPNFHFLIDSVKEGRLPLWNPYIGLGRPYLADPQNAVFYPPVYLMLLGERAGLFLLVWSHCLIGVLGMRSLGRELEVGRWQSYFMAASFLASGALTARLMSGQILYCCAICYIPWLFCLANHLDEPWSPHRFASYAILLALQFLCGHPQIFWLSCIGQIVYAFGRCCQTEWRISIASAWRSLWHFLVASIWCCGLIAIVLLPFLELIQQGNRPGNSPEFVSFGKLAWEDLGSLAIPLGINPQYAVNWEANLFVGLPVLVLGLMGFSRLKERNTRGLISVLLVGLLIALGNNTPFFHLFYKWLPGYASLRIHSRAGVLIVLALVASGGMWLSRPHSGLLSFVTRNFPVSIRHLAVGLLALQVVLLAYATWSFRSAYSFQSIARHSPDYPFQQSLLEQLGEKHLLQASGPPPMMCIPWDLIPANYAMIYKYGNFDAYTSLFLRRTWDYLHGAVEIKPPSLRNTSIAAEIYDHGPFPYPDLPVAGGIDPSTHSLVFATNTAPRAFLTYRWMVICDQRQLVTRLQLGHDIHQCALLESELTHRLLVTDPPAFTAVPIDNYEQNGLTLDVQARENALLVLTEAWYPGWLADVDGRICSCVPANLCMRAAPITRGRHHVRLCFHQNFLALGSAISAMSGVALISLLLQKSIRRRNHPMAWLRTFWGNG